MLSFGAKSNKPPYKINVLEGRPVRLWFHLDFTKYNAASAAAMQAVVLWWSYLP
jgi:hypothetical protein